MSSDEIRNPGSFRWVETGVSGLARAREWDVTSFVELPQLEGSALGRVELAARPEGVEAPTSVPSQVVAAIVAELDGALERPYRARAVRQSQLRWLVAARAVRSHPFSLPEDMAASLLEVALPPEGERWVSVDGEVAAEPLEAPLAEAVRALERHATERFASYVVRAERTGRSVWDVTVDPL